MGNTGLDNDTVQNLQWAKSLNTFFGNFENDPELDFLPIQLNFYLYTLKFFKIKSIEETNRKVYLFLLFILALLSNDSPAFLVDLHFFQSRALASYR